VIEIENLRLDFSSFCLDDICLDVKESEFFILLGPTGAGKTLILEAITGTGPVHGGTIRVGGRDITSLPPEKRGIGIVYQDYALFPHLSVMENITYGLRYHSNSSTDSRRWVEELMMKLGIRHIADRSITHLSGGEKQRIALARALSVHPSVLLLDEPLSALDPNFRAEIREVLKKLHKEMGITFLMVTHDFSEALFLGERTAILNHGKIEQMGSVKDVFSRPKTPFVAEFVGMKNVLPAVFEGTSARVGDLVFDIGNMKNEGRSFIAIRAEDILIRKERIAEGDTNVFACRIMNVADLGVLQEVSIKCGSTIFTAILSKGDLLYLDLSESRDVYMAVRNSAIHLL